ncbi:hypothetical protein OHR68_00770 [Spirillospora sp. NBC_00431]
MTQTLPKTAPSWLSPITADRRLEQLRRFHLEKVGSAFKFVRDTLLTESPELARKSDFSNACEVLDGRSFAQVEPIIGHPAFERWLHWSLTLIRRDAHRNLAHAGTVSHFGALSTFAASAVIASAGRATLILPIDSRGNIHLRGLGQLLGFPLEAAGHRVECGITECGITEWGGATALTPTSEDPAVGRRIMLPRHGPGWEINRVDSLLTGQDALHEAGAEPVPGEPNGLAAAWRLIESEFPKLAIEISHFLRVVSPTVAASGTVPCLGLWEYPESADAVGAARALIASSQEAKVDILLNALVSSEERRARHGGSWNRIAAAARRAARSDAVRAFSEGIPDTEQDVLEAAGRTCAEAVAALADERPLPDFVESLIDFWAGRGAPDRPAPAVRAEPAKEPAERAIPAKDAELIERFSALWEKAGGERRGPTRQKTLKPAPEVRDIAAAAGIPDGVPINSPYAGDDRADPSLDRLGIAHVRDADRLAELRRLLTEKPVSDDPLERMLRGHVCYIDGNMAEAAEHYAVAVQAIPDNLDFWHDLSFALQHLDHPEAQLFRFHPDLLAKAAGGLRMSSAVAGRLLAERSGRGSDEPPALAPPLRMMRCLEQVIEEGEAACGNR